MDRRTFLLSAGRWLLLAGLSPFVAGCGRVLRWSESQGAPPLTYGAATVTSTSTTIVSAGPDSTSPSVTTSASTSTSTDATAVQRPDLVVVRGDLPDENVRIAMARLGGMGTFVKRDAKVVIKPNVLTGRAPEYATTTNPLVVSALVRLCLEAGAAEVTVLDYPTSSARAAFRESGIAQATEEAGGRLKYLESRHFDRVEIPQGEAISSWPFVADVFEADTFINVPIGKTHGMAGLTLSMKNLMGIMGDRRGEIHTDYPRKITDVATLVKPHLVVLDAYRILVRNGPTGGDLDDVEMPRTVVVGTSQTAVDAYGATIMGWDPADLPSLAEAGRRGLGEIDPAKLRIEEAAS